MQFNKKDKKKKKKKHHRHIGFSFLFILSLDKMTLFYIIKEPECSLSRKFSEYEFCCFQLKVLFLTILVNTEVQKN